MIGDAQTPELVDGVPSDATAQPVEPFSPWRIAGASLMATMGALPVRPVETDPSPFPAIAGQLMGATAGGAVVGYMAAGDVRGAFTAALMTGGLAGLLDASILMRRQEHRTIAGMVGAASLVSLLGSFWLATHREP